jgi:Asp-tRNA(Asn)/Glu-tRNA(Gln) amidotransferase A subunit family amidase
MAESEISFMTATEYDTTKTCGGSSGGAAVALACGLLPLADGSDMGGSLRNPGNFCNIVGFRTSPGRVPVGIQIVGRYNNDFGVLQLAYAFERTTRMWQRRPPVLD